MFTQRLPRGVLVAFEGIDGSGKSTQAKKFVAWARTLGVEVISSREPTDGPWGKKIREARFTARMSPEEELAAFIADRKEHVATLIKPALARGALVVIDRYYYSTVAYQGARGLEPKALLEMNRAFAPVPDLVVLVDVEPKAALERIASRGEGTDLFETLSALTRVREIFLSLVDSHVAKIDGARDPEVVFGDVLLRVLSGPLAGFVGESDELQPVAKVFENDRLSMSEKAERIRKVLGV
ncbi:MAG: dTMP kinase [Archangium sp.]|nr:dTMP kinase [Archangium sp.]MDP3154774.1 dTMP kinase [Archangium sp.]MDP3573664.1 dTMP kinase [Archangium sp.]